MTSLPLSVRTSSIHLVVCWNELTSVGRMSQTCQRGLNKSQPWDIHGDHRQGNKSQAERKHKEKRRGKKEGHSKAGSVSVLMCLSKEVGLWKEFICEDLLHVI